MIFLVLSLQGATALEPVRFRDEGIFQIFGINVRVKVSSGSLFLRLLKRGGGYKSDE